MTRQVMEHPSDELLTEFACEGADTVVDEHVRSCPSCSRFVKEINAVRDSLRSLPDEEVPERLRRAVMKSTRFGRRGSLPWFVFSTLYLFKNPLAIGIGVILTVLFLYIFFVFIL